MNSLSETPSPPTSGFLLVATGVALFLFIPVVLFLFVSHPEPIGLSLAVGVVLMLGHRFLARPYMRWALPHKCLWCNRVLGDRPSRSLELATSAGPLSARCCPEHHSPAARFFGFTDRARWPLRLGIFVPLLLLLITLGLAAAGRTAALEEVTAVFRLTIGLTVNAAALGYRWASPADPASVPFPVHNFFLLGVRNLLWIFRLMGVWWIYLGLRALLAG